MEKMEELLKRPFYVFDIPTDILDTLERQTSTTSVEPRDEAPTEKEIVPTESQDAGSQPGKKAMACALCSSSFQDLAEQRRHFRSDWHGYNLKRKQNSLPTVDEAGFEKVIEDLDESISGSESSSSDDGLEAQGQSTMLAQLLRKQTRLKDEHDAVDLTTNKKKRGAGAAPLIWFSSPQLPPKTFLGVYRALFTSSDLEGTDLIDRLRDKQLKPQKALVNAANDVAQVPSGPTIFLCMIGGGHFAGLIVSLTPKMTKRANGIEERQAIVVAHKTFHRYTTRRKQGGSQSANDSAKGAAHSAGAGIRRYNEAALEAEVRALLNEWKTLLHECQLHFVRATGMTNRRTLFGPYEGQILHHKDPRNRGFPFSTRRATQAELMRSFVELTRMKVSDVEEAVTTARAQQERHTKVAPTPPKSPAPKLSKEEETALLHTSQLQALVKRSKVPAVLTYIISNSISPDFGFHPPSSQVNHHASTPLHLASSINSPRMVLSLLEKAGADPTVLNGEGRPPFDLAGDRPTRDAFRVARSILGEMKWDWDKARCPSAMSKEESDQKEAAERAASERTETQRRRAETERLEKESSMSKASKDGSVYGKSLAGLETTAADKREQEARGLTPELRAKLERERRAKAAEARISRLSGS